MDKMEKSIELLMRGAKVHLESMLLVIGIMDKLLSSDAPVTQHEVAKLHANVDHLKMIADKIAIPGAADTKAEAT